MEAVCSEYNGFDNMCVWQCVLCPPGETLHDSMLLIKEKVAPDGSFLKVKARCVIRGDHMVQGVHNTDTLAPTTGLCALRFCLSNTVTYGWCGKSFDVSQAFCNPLPEFLTSLCTPPGLKQRYASDGKPMCYKQDKQTYGIPNGPRRWHIVLHNWLMPTSRGTRRYLCVRG